jgi:CubicO group peptidase (beta-lactamase class C family)
VLLSLAAVLVAGLVTTSAQADLPFAKAETVGMSSKRLERLNAFIKDYIDANQIAGAVTLVARKGKIVHFESQGWRYKEENQPMEKDAIFSLASMTKPIVSTALMMLWEDGKLCSTTDLEVAAVTPKKEADLDWPSACLRGR